MQIELELQEILGGVRVGAWRISLSTPGVRTSCPQLRGVWGAALRGVDEAAYHTVFEGEGPCPNERTPAYVLRPAPPDPVDSPAIECIVLGRGLAHLESLFRAWDVASGMGLGPSRKRFFIRAVRDLNPLVATLPQCARPTAWSLNEAPWPLGGNPATTPCRLTFSLPLRLIRDGCLIEAPLLADIFVAAARRVAAFLEPAEAVRLHKLQFAILDRVRTVCQGGWRGHRLDLERYSGRQKERIRLHGVSGELDLPEGAGKIWPLLAAARWTHLGKGTTQGLGKLEVEPLPHSGEAGLPAPHD